MGEHAKTHDLHEKLLPLWNAMPHDYLPACVKYAQSLQEGSAGLSRAPMPMPNDTDKANIKKALLGLGLL